jgi:hypothetical protein
MDQVLMNSVDVDASVSKHGKGSFENFKDGKKSLMEEYLVWAAVSLQLKKARV